MLNCAIDLAYMLELEQCINPRDSDLKEIAETVQRRLEHYVDKKCNKWDSIVENMGLSETI